MKKLFAVVSLTFALTVVCSAQSFRFNVDALNKEQYNPQVFNPKEVVEYSHAVSAEVEARAVSYEGLSLNGVGTYQYDFTTQVHTVFAGGRLRYKYKILSPYVGFHVGFEQASGFEKEFCREIQAGLTLDFGRFSVLPLGYGQKRKGALFSPAETRFYSGIGINIK